MVEEETIMYVTEFASIAIFEELVLGSDIEDILRESIVNVLHTSSMDELGGASIDKEEIYKRLLFIINKYNLIGNLDTSRISHIARKIYGLKGTYVIWCLTNNMTSVSPISFSGFYLKYNRI